MITVGVSDFRASMNSFLQKVQNGEIVILTSRGVEIAKLVPPDFAQYAARHELQLLRETTTVGDVLSPVQEDDHWNAAQKIVVDTQVLIWDALAPDRLSKSANQLISHANQQD